MKNLFDYLGYRVLRWDKIIRDSKSRTRGIAYFSLIQIVLLLDIVAVIVTENFTKIEKYRMIGTAKICALIGVLIIYILNTKYFNNKYTELQNKWVDENLKKKKLRGWLIVICFLFIFLFWIFYLKIRRNVNG